MAVDQQNGANGADKKQPWVMNAFAMTAPGHLAPGNDSYQSDISIQPRY